MNHTSDAVLLGWLATKPERLEKHLDQHPEDIERLEQLTELAPAHRDAVERSVSAPDDIAERVYRKMQVDPRLRDAGSAFAELFTLGVRTMRVVFGSDPTEPDVASDRTERDVT
jgi:hypothetical protein